MNKNTAVTVALVLVVGVGGFFGGMTYQKSQTQTSGFGQFGGSGGRPGFNGNGTGGYGGMARGAMGGGAGGFVTGEIIEKDGSSITVKMEDGSTKIVMVSSTATVNKASKGTKEDLKVGESVMVTGQANSDGSVSATNINVGEYRFGRPPIPQNDNQGGNSSGTQQGQSQ